ncbi:DUF1569 domain-containing protein [Planctomicrobium sp. SH527]|uniref:DUF1569 domain-containing protein n=1 Tax=Planctomicrobium sp. SH527 TaxID=3448123 RepID=UPI003F5B7B5A
MTWDEVDSRLDHLLQGYTQKGNWNLTQVALHLDDWVRFPIEGFPTPPLGMRLFVPIIRLTMAKKVLRQILDQGFDDNIPTMPKTVHSRDESTEAVAVERLRQSITRFRNHIGTIHPSTFFGKLDKATTEKLQLRHFEHHLKFLEPRSGSTP